MIEHSRSTSKSAVYHRSCDFLDGGQKETKVCRGNALIDFAAASFMVVVELINYLWRKFNLVAFDSTG